MKRMTNGFSLFLLMFCVSIATGQEEEESTKYKGVALDVFPLLNSIFSDDGSSSLFQVTYVWGEYNRRYELGFSPQYTHVGGSSDVAGLDSYGAGIEFFHGRQYDIGKKWRGTWGMSYRYRFNQQVSESGGFGNSKLNTTTHTAGIGPQFMFGYQLSKRVLIRSRISGILQFQDTSTKIKDGPFNAGDQNVTTINLQFNAPRLLELLLFF